MKVCIRKILKKEDEQVVIECTEITPEVEDIRTYVMGKGVELSGATNDRRTERFRLESVLKRWTKSCLPTRGRRCTR